MDNEPPTDMDDRVLTKEERRRMQLHMSLQLLRRINWQEVIEENDPALWQRLLSHLFVDGEDMGDEVLGEQAELLAAYQRAPRWYEEYEALPGESDEQHFERIVAMDSDEEDMDYDPEEDGDGEDIYNHNQDNSGYEDEDEEMDSDSDSDSDDGEEDLLVDIE